MSPAYWSTSRRRCFLHGPPPHYQTRRSRGHYSGPRLHAGWLLKKVLELADFFDNCLSSTAPRTEIVGCTGFPTDSHDNVWMEVNDKKEHHRCVECGHGAFSFGSARTFTDNFATQCSNCNTLGVRRSMVMATIRRFTPVAWAV